MRNFNSSQAPDVLFGPYGSVLENAFRKSGAELPKQDLLHRGSVTADIHRQIVEKYLNAGAGIPTTNTFRLLQRLGGNVDLFKEVLERHFELVHEHVKRRTNRPIFISVGPKGDCYKPEEAPGRDESEGFHGLEMAAIAGIEGIKRVLLETFNSGEEVVGAVRAAVAYGLKPYVSLVLAEDGLVKGGESIDELIELVDSETNSAPEGYLANCVTLNALDNGLNSIRGSRERFVGFYPNASSVPAWEIENSGAHHGIEDMDEYVRTVVELAQYFNAKIVGGCCGHDHTTIGEIHQAFNSEEKLVAAV